MATAKDDYPPGEAVRAVRQLGRPFLDLGELKTCLRQAVRMSDQQIVNGLIGLLVVDGYFTKEEVRQAVEQLP